MKIYTGTGDEGKTSLFSGERIAKSDARIEVYGTVDELNAVVGALAASLPAVDGTGRVRAQLVLIQSDLFHVGAWLATTPDSPSAAHLTPFTDQYRERLELQIDAMDGELEPLRAFILPGGHPSAAWAHVARTVCRRAERQAVSLGNRKMLMFQGAPEMLVYLNRLSDYFFVMARYCNLMAGVKEDLWHG